MLTVSQAVAPLAVTLFGPMQVSVEGQSLPRLRSRKSLWLLALLVLKQGRPVEREWLAETLWPDADLDQSLTSLRTVLSELRQALVREGGRLQSPNRHSLCLELGGMSVDLLEFDAAKVSRDPVVLKQAVALYRGPLLEGCTEEWVAQERLAREQDCLQALQTLADAALAAGDFEVSAGYYRQAVGIDPWREAAQRGLMQALSESGDSNAALTVYQALTRLLRKDDPRASPDEKTTALYASLRAEARRRASQPPVVETVPPPAVTGHVPHSLTDLIGREEEREVVAGRLRRSRLMTLTGPGGIGKTRLALAVASEVAAEYADGAWLVGLDSLSDGTQVERQIVSVLGLKEDPERTALQTLTAFLRPKRLLLVLDNCEHLLDASARVAAHLLRDCAGVQVLATSREPLGITGEAAWAVPGLTMPDSASLRVNPAPLPHLLMEYESVRLFVERAQAVNHHFELTASNAPAVAKVCARLEGIPLAIELAAARVRVLTAEQIAARLDDYLSLLTGGSRTASPRQQTLRATLDWSYDLLSRPSRLLLARLSVFAGGWTLAAAEQVCAGDEIDASHVLDLLTGLVDKSLVAIVPVEGEPRYRLLEPIRQYAEKRLAECGETESLRDRHLFWCVVLAEDAEPRLRGHEQGVWLARLETEHDNLRASLAWGAESVVGTEQTLRLAAALYGFWFMRGHLSEGRRWLDLALARAGTSGEEARGAEASVIRARALHGAGGLAQWQRDYAGTRALYEESLSLYRQLGDQEGIANTLNSLGTIACCQGDYAGARALFEDNLSLYRQLGHQSGIATALLNLGNVAECQSDYAGARVLYEECLPIRRQLGQPSGIANTLLNLGAVAQAQGDLAGARALFEESLTIRRQSGHQPGIATALLSLGWLAQAQGDLAGARALFEESLTIRRQFGIQHDISENLEGLAGVAYGLNQMVRAAQLWGAASSLRDTIGDLLPSAAQEEMDKRVSSGRTALGEDSFAAAWDAGRAMTLDEAVKYALGER